MVEANKEIMSQYKQQESVFGSVLSPNFEGNTQTFVEVRVVSEPGARAFEQEVNQLLREGWMLLDAKVVSQSMQNPDTRKVCESSRLRAILGKTTNQ